MINQLKQHEIINTLSSLTDEQIEILNQFIKSFIAQPKSLQNTQELLDENLIMKDNPETYSFLQNDYAYSSSDLKEKFQ